MRKEQGKLQFKYAPVGNLILKKVATRSNKMNQKTKKVIKKP